jgi:hypothetical protein
LQKCDVSEACKDMGEKSYNNYKQVLKKEVEGCAAKEFSDTLMYAC